MDKLFCYIDETGQDTRGVLFIVAVVITSQQRDVVEKVCEEDERNSGKGKVKWRWADHHRRLDFIQQIVQAPVMKNTLHFTMYHNRGTDYLRLTVNGIAAAIFSRVQHQSYEATVFIDGLPRSQQKPVGALLRQDGIRVRKVRGVRKEENDPFIRLADALCGLVRAAHRGEAEARRLLDGGKVRGLIKEDCNK